LKRRLNFCRNLATKRAESTLKGQLDATTRKKFQSSDRKSDVDFPVETGRRHRRRDMLSPSSLPCSTFRVLGSRVGRRAERLKRRDVKLIVARRKSRCSQRLNHKRTSKTPQRRRRDAKPKKQRRKRPDDDNGATQKTRNNNIENAPTATARRKNKKNVDRTLDAKGGRRATPTLKVEAAQRV